MRQRTDRNFIITSLFVAFRWSSACARIPKSGDEASSTAVRSGNGVTAMMLFRVQRTLFHLQPQKGNHMGVTGLVVVAVDTKVVIYVLAGSVVGIR